MPHHKLILLTSKLFVMKNAFFSLPAIAILIGLSPKPADDNSESRGAGMKKTSPIDGAWKLVWATTNGKPVDVGKNPQIKFFADGCFSLLASNAEGKIDYAGYGTFELDGTNYKEIFLYHNYSPYVGAINWQEMELKGDTLYAIGFKQVIIQEKVVNDFPMIEEKRVRMP